jgi:hypothetical protein
LATVTINGAEHEVQRFVLVKALRVITLLNVIQRLLPEGTEQLGEFISAYRRTHVEELDRVQAKLRYGGEIPVVQDGKPVLDPKGEVVTIRSPIDLLTEDDWNRAGQVYRRAEDPPVAAMVAAILPSVAENAERPLLRLLAVCIIDNDDFRRFVHNETWEEEADRVSRDVLEGAYFEEVIELAAVVADVLEGSALAKMREVAGKFRGLLGRLGIEWPTLTQGAEGSMTSSESPDASSPSGSTSSAPDTTGGDPTTSGTFPGTSPSLSATAGASDEMQTSSTPPESRVPA